MGLQLTARRAKCWYLNVSEDSNGGGISGNVTYGWRVPVSSATLADCVVRDLGIVLLLVLLVFCEMKGVGAYSSAVVVEEKRRSKPTSQALRIPTSTPSLPLLFPKQPSGSQERPR
jgi:hypothetical protein